MCQLRSFACHFRRAGYFGAAGSPKNADVKDIQCSKTKHEKRSQFEEQMSPAAAPVAGGQLSWAATSELDFSNLGRQLECLVANFQGQKFEKIMSN